MATNDTTRDFGLLTGWLTGSHYQSSHVNGFQFGHAVTGGNNKEKESSIEESTTFERI